MADPDITYTLVSVPNVIRMRWAAGWDNGSQIMRWLEDQVEEVSMWDGRSGPILC